MNDDGLNGSAGLLNDERKMIRNILEDCAERTLANFFCLVDGVGGRNRPAPVSGKAEVDGIVRANKFSISPAGVMATAASKVDYTTGSPSGGRSVDQRAARERIFMAYAASILLSVFNAKRDLRGFLHSSWVTPATQRY